jgi:hypothetical protein
VNLRDSRISIHLIDPRYDYFLFSECVKLRPPVSKVTTNSSAEFAFHRLWTIFDIRRLHTHSVFDRYQENSFNGFETQLDHEKTVIVFDFGCGTLNVSVMIIQGKRFSVLALTGDTHLGGRDFDSRVMQFCLQAFDSTGQTTQASLVKRKLQKLKQKCEDAKCDLSHSERMVVYLEDFFPGRDLDVAITQSQFGNECRDLFDRILDPVEEVLEYADKPVQSIDDVILIGVSSAIPEVKRLLRLSFEKKPFSVVTQQEAVATGATVLAGFYKKGDGLPDVRRIECRDIRRLPLGADCGRSDGCHHRARLSSARDARKRLSHFSPRSDQPHSASA